MRGAPALLAVLLAGCTPDTDGADPTDPCDHDGALATCLEPTQSVEIEDWPPYSELVARWEWPPWLKLTAYTRENIEATDTLLTMYPSVVPERDCRAFDTQPFGRCYVVFYYDAHEGRGCPIYEEFTFNDAGEITWIEAWSDVEGLRPTSDEDRWGEQSDIGRLSNRIPGLGNAGGRIDLDSEWMQAAAAEDADVADFVERANDWYETWLEEYTNAPDDYWDIGCGW